MHICVYTDVWHSCKPLLLVSRANEDISPLWCSDACLDLPKPACLPTSPPASLNAYLPTFLPNDLPASLKALIPVMFADDTNLVLKGNNLQDMISKLNADLETLHDFFKANKLKLTRSS